jgi:hypothetical protein
VVRGQLVVLDGPPDGPYAVSREKAMKHAHRRSGESSLQRENLLNFLVFIRPECPELYGRSTKYFLLFLMIYKCEFEFSNSAEIKSKKRNSLDMKSPYSLR